MNSTSKQNMILGVAAVAIMAAIAWVSLRGTDPLTNSATVSKADDVLSPDSFADERTRAAYQVAKDIPEVLEEMPCFCGCKSIGHKSNLFCFKDNHGAACAMCQDIALDAKKMHDQGMPIAQIQDKIKAKYGPQSP